MKKLDNNKDSATENLIYDVIHSFKKFIESIYRLLLKIDLETIVEEEGKEEEKNPSILLCVKSRLGTDAGRVVRKNNHLFYIYLSGDYPFCIDIHTIPSQKLTLKSSLFENFKFLENKIISPAILPKGRYLFRFLLTSENQQYPFSVVVINELA